MNNIKILYFDRIDVYKTNKSKERDISLFVFFKQRI